MQALLPIKIKGSVTPAVVANNPASGAPAISGAAQVGMTLTANTDDIEDDDGVGTLAYQWVRITEADVETNIGTNASTYTLTAAEQGHNIRVDVSFTDDANNAEGPLPSGETLLVMPAAVSNCDSSDPWCATLTVGHEELTMQQIDDGESPSVGFRASPSYGSVSPATFTHDGDQYTVTALSANHSSTYELFFATTPNLPADGAGLTLHVQKYSGELSLPLSEASFNSTTNLWIFDDALFVESTASLSEAPLLRARGTVGVERVEGKTDVGTQVAVRLSASDNNPATGAPTISGPAQVGMTLTANTDDIDDDDGVGTLAYQWVRITEGGRRDGYRHERQHLHADRRRAGAQHPRGRELHRRRGQRRGAARERRDVAGHAGRGVQLRHVGPLVRHPDGGASLGHGRLRRAGGIPRVAGLRQRESGHV